MKRIALLFALALSLALVAQSYVVSLSSPASAGATSISVTAPVRPGEKLLIVGPTEELVTAGIGANVFTPSVTPALRHDHPAGAAVLVH